MTIDQSTAQRAIDAKTKPLGALGRLEDVAMRLAILQGTLSPALDRTRICVFAADHGVTAEGVSAYPSAVTAEMMKNFARGGAAINVIARANTVDVEVIDVGVDADLSMFPEIIHAKVCASSRNFAVEPALSEAELDAALDVGRVAARRAAAAGVKALGLGEMGIGNTTSAAALLSSLTGQAALVTVGRGTGVSDEMLVHKRSVVDAALEHHGLHGAHRDARRCLQCVGGLEIAAIVGAALEAADLGIAVVADGFISTVAIAAAAALAKSDALGRAVFFSHRSVEAGHTLALDLCASLLRTSARPLLDLEMRLGEGSGAALAMPLLRSAAAVMREMATFESAGVSPGENADAHSGHAPA